MILFDDVWFSYTSHHPVLRGICLELRPGEVIGLMGENGAGKTTLVKHINGLLKPTRGAVYVNGIDTQATSTAQLAQQVGFVFQNADHQLFADTLKNEVAFALRNLNFPEEEIDDRVERYLQLFQLTQYQDQSPFLLSGVNENALRWRPSWL